MVRVLLSRRMLAFHALVLLIIPSFIALGFWQLGRYEEKSARVALQEANLAADPVPAERLTEVGQDVAPADRWRPVTATGEYDTEHQLLVRHRSSDTGGGFYVMTPLITEDGTGLLVNRGWVQKTGTARGTPDVAPPPSGEVTVTGRLQYTETAANTGIRPRGGLPENQIMIINVPSIAGELSYPVYGGFVELTRQEPTTDSAPEPVGGPEEGYGPHLAYAVQWWIFTVIAVVGWVFLVRREVIESRQDPGGDGEAPDGSPEPSSRSEAAV